MHITVKNPPKHNNIFKVNPCLTHLTVGRHFPTRNLQVSVKSLDQVIFFPFTGSLWTAMQDYIMVGLHGKFGD